MADIIKGCFADRMRLSRGLIPNGIQVGVTNANQTIFVANPRRTRLIVGGITANRVTIKFGAVAVDGQGFIIPANAVQFVFRIEEYGIQITDSVNVIGNVAGPFNMFLQEIVLNDV